MIRIILQTLIFLFIFPFFVHSQLAGSELIKKLEFSEGKGEVNIVQDDKIAMSLDKHIYEESKNRGISGYRIRIFSNSGANARKEGQEAMAGFIKRFPNLATYFIFDTPFYRLYVGDFRNRSEAYKYLEKIEDSFPSAFIVRSKINYPSLK